MSLQGTSGSKPKQDTLAAFTKNLAHGLAGAYLAVSAFLQACRSPAVRDTINKTSKTVVITALCHYLLLTILLWPLAFLFKMIKLFSFNLLRPDATAFAKSSMSIYPLFTVMLVRYVYQSSMAECFCHTLQQLDPKYAAHLATQPRKYKPTTTQKVLAKLGLTGDDSDDFKTMLLLMAAGLVLAGIRRFPYIGWLVAPMIQFLSIRYMVGRPVAAVILSVIAASGAACEQYIVNFVELWASSKVLGRSSMRYFMDRTMPRSRQFAFVRTFEYTIVSYFLLPTAIMRIPILGSLVAFPAAAVGAYALQDILSRQVKQQRSFEQFTQAAS